jgi:hypothetical protein
LCATDLNACSNACLPGFPRGWGNIAKISSGISLGFNAQILRQSENLACQPTTNILQQQRVPDSQVYSYQACHPRCLTYVRNPTQTYCTVSLLLLLLLLQFGTLPTRRRGTAEPGASVGECNRQPHLHVPERRKLVAHCTGKHQRRCSRRHMHSDLFRHVSVV